MNKLKQNWVSYLLGLLAAIVFYLVFKWKKGNSTEKAKAKKFQWVAYILVVVAVGFGFKDKIQEWIAKRKAAKA